MLPTKNMKTSSKNKIKSEIIEPTLKPPSAMSKQCLVFTCL